ncbi:hypothetical protein [Enterococcus mundtii]|uniref:Uncharacterized protein n=1 Tax=Enterococcus mundtii TaxID=53346 RepID=A0A1V2U9U3_ENTMU|nr:hypothetical protein [Enterococcus mundtii]ONN40023.1 hypothetical protein BTN92_15910 [Enterococcus mundtii]
MEKDKSLIIWNKDGSTMKFEKVTNFRDEWQKEQISFEYFGVSTQVRRKAVFYTNNIAGYALEQEEIK